MKKRLLSLLLVLVLTVGLFSGLAQPAEASTFADLLEKYFFNDQNSILQEFYGDPVKSGTCGKGDRANAWYEIYEVSNPQELQKKYPYFAQLMGSDNPDFAAEYDPDQQYYGVKIYGNGEMEDYSLSKSAPWCDKITLSDGTEVDMDQQLLMAYVEGASQRTVGSRTVNYTGVTNVGQRAFFGQDELMAVFLGNTVEKIDDRAFESTEKLGAINMPSGLSYLGARAFYGCDALTFWRAGSCTKLTTIGERAFYGCSHLATVEFPANLTSIPQWAFAWCRILGDENFVLPSKLKTIGEGAFAFDTHMGRVNEINIPTSVTTISPYAFLCCFGIGKGDNDGLTFTEGGSQLLSIGNYAFAGCRELKTLKLDNRVTQIHTGAFAACARLESVVFGNDQNARAVSIDANAFTNVQEAKLKGVDALTALSADSSVESDFDPLRFYDAEDTNVISTWYNEQTPLQRAAFPNRPATRINAASDTKHSFPEECVVHYPSASYNPTANSAWLGALASDSTWKGYNTVGDWTGHFHIYEDTVVEPTCTKDGYTRHECSICHEYYDDEIVPASHDLVELRRLEPTCTTNGAIVYQCSREDCPDKTIVEILPALGHDYSQCDVLEPTCTEPGYREGVCPRCGQNIHESLKPKGHNPDPRFMEEIKAPTCTTSGIYRGFCIDCMQDNVTAYTEPLGHDWDEGKITKAPTATQEGVRTYTCKNDPSHTRTEKIPALGGSEPVKFKDVPADSYYADAVQWAVDRNITNGTSNTTFSPNRPCTRAQMVTFLWRAVGSPAPKSSNNPFTDVKAGTYYYDAVLWAVEQGITNGTSATTFSPDAKVTRAQTVTFLWRFEGEKDPMDDTNIFTDVKAGTYYYDAVLWAVEEGITNGTSSTTFSPNSPCTRAQIVTFLYRDMV